MKIINTYNWNRRDFCYDAECESCGHIEKNLSGYDDDHYYNTVMPAKVCKNCGKTSSEPVVTIPRYDPNITM